MAVVSKTILNALSLTADRQIQRSWKKLRKLEIDAFLISISSFQWQLDPKFSFLMQKQIQSNLYYYVELVFSVKTHFSLL